MRSVPRPTAILAAVALLAGTARGHVKYVTEGSGEPLAPAAFLIAVLSDPLNLALVGGGAVAGTVAAGWYLAAAPVRRDVAAFRSALAEYEAFVPWILRLSVGLPLVGAGFAGYYFSPSVPTDLRVPQLVAGFLLLFGLATRATAAVTLAAYLAGLAAAPELLLASEYVPGLVGIVVLGGGRPAADHLFARVAAAEGTAYGVVDPVARLSAWFDGLVVPYVEYVPAVVRVGIGLNFAYLGVTQKLLEPGRALLVVEKYGLASVVPVDPGLWVVGAGLAELAIGLLLIAGVFTRATAMVAFGMFTLTLFGLPDDPVLAHVTLFGMSSAVVVMGGGPLSVDRWLARGRSPAVPDETPRNTSGEDT